MLPSNHNQAPSSGLLRTEPSLIPLPSPTPVCSHTCAFTHICVSSRLCLLSHLCLPVSALTRIEQTFRAHVYVLTTCHGQLHVTWTYFRMVHDSSRVCPKHLSTTWPPRA